MATGLLSSFTAPMHALPLDAFRVLAGIVSFFYFGRTLLEVADFSSPRGVLDHRLSLRIFPPTRLGAFQPGMPAGLFALAFALGCAASLALAAGWHPRVAAALLFVIAVSAYRWNFLVMYVDDGIMHLVLFWLVLLPIGETLTLQGFLRDGSAALHAWTAVSVSGGVVRGFLANLALAYLVAGAYKWTSPMWRDGSALQAILMMPIGRMPGAWGPRHRAVLVPMSLAALATEPLFPLAFVLPSGSAAKWLAVAAVVGFHVGIVATLRIPFANAAMLGAVPIVLGDESMRALGAGVPRTTTASAGPGVAEVLGVVVVSCLAGMVLREVIANGVSRPPLYRTNTSRFRRDPMCAVLWLLGIAQSYRLFDWVDRRNFHVRYRVVEHDPGGATRELDPDALFPRAMRHLILQSYLHGSIWLQVDEALLRELRRAILHRYAARYARRRGAGDTSGVIEAYAIVQRITADNLDLSRGVSRLLMRFTCAGGEATVHHVSLDPEAPAPSTTQLPGAARSGARVAAGA